MKELFEEVAVEVVVIEANDVICDSTGTGGGNNYETPGTGCDDF